MLKYCSLLIFSILYGGEDPSIAGMVLDSAFSNLFDLMMELVDVYKIRLPKFTVSPLFLSHFFGPGCTPASNVPFLDVI